MRLAINSFHNIFKRQIFGSIKKCDEKSNTSYNGAQKQSFFVSDNDFDINSFLSMKDDEGNSLFFSNALIDLLKKSNSNTKKAMYDILNIKDDKGKRLFLPSCQLLEFLKSCSKDEYANLIRLISVKDKNGERLFLTQPAIIDLVQMDKETCLKRNI